MKLENWSLQHGAYEAPELGCHLLGNVFGHPTRPDGRCVRTSSIIHINVEEETVTTHSGSIYKLGEPEPGYEALFPNVKERVFAMANEVNNE